jgi:glycosyltransferase involved in cell wall biosynthesis
MTKVSIIVPVYESPNFIEPFFKFFHQNPLPNGIELIIVDNGSTDIFYNELVTQGESIINCNIYRYSEKQSSYAARNFGVSQSKGQVLAFTDFDCILSKSYIDLLLTIDINPKNIISGKVELFYIKNNVYEFFDNHYYLDQKRYSTNKKGATANLVVPKLIFEDLNGFSEFTSGGDGEFCHRVNLNGYGFEYNEDLIIGHPARNSLKDHLIKAKRIGIGTGQFFLSHNNSKVKKIFTVSKNLLLIPFPFYPIKIGIKIFHENHLNFNNFFKLIFLLYKVSFFQRINIIKTILKS